MFVLTPARRAASRWSAGSGIGIPSVFHPDVASAVAVAVGDATGGRPSRS